MSVTLQAAVHLGKDYSEKLHSIKNQPKRTLKQLFNETEKLIRDQTEISGIPVIKWQLLVWQRTSLLTDQFSLRLQKPTSFPIQYCVWEESVQIPSKHGRRRLIGL